MTEASETLRFLYEENAKIVAIFWEWRNKIITYFFTAVGALFAVSGWLYQQRVGRWVSVPLILGALLSYFAIRLDKRNKNILKSCYKAGKAIESKLLEHLSKVDDAAIFTRISKAHDDKEVTYSQTLYRTYLLVAALLLAIAALIILFPLYPPIENK